MKTDPTRWNSLPGSFNALNARQILYSDNEWGIPEIKNTPLEALPEWLAPYRTRFRTKRTLNFREGGYHFFISDYEMRCVWERPQVAIKFMRKLPVVLSPNFSLSGSLSEQLFAVYRNRWCGSWWQLQGLTVIPSVSWAGRESYDFCFAGVESGGVVAISARNCQQFLAGFDEMISRLSPTQILCLGEPPGMRRASRSVIPTELRGAWTASVSTPEITIYPEKWRLRNIK